MSQCSRACVSITKSLPKIRPIFIENVDRIDLLQPIRYEQRPLRRVLAGVTVTKGGMGAITSKVAAELFATLVWHVRGFHT